MLCALDSEGVEQAAKESSREGIMVAWLGRADQGSLAIFVFFFFSSFLDICGLPIESKWLVLSYMFV